MSCETTSQEKALGGRQITTSGALQSFINRWLSHRIVENKDFLKDRECDRLVSKIAYRFYLRFQMKIDSWKYLVSFMAGEVLNLSLRIAPKLDRVAHPFAHFAKGWGIARSATAALIATMVLCPHAQSIPCAMSGILHSGQLAYPPMAIMAHVVGDITLNAVFSPDGSVTSVHVTGGPALLDMRKAATNYVGSWQINGSSLEQECPVTISFRIEGAPDCYFHPSTVTMTDLQHFIVTANPIQTCDPAGTGIRHHFLFFHWYSESK